MSYPENPPQLNFAEYQKKIANNDVVKQLEQAYKSLKITYPKDYLSPEVDKQELESQKQNEAYYDVANANIAQAEKLV